MTLTRPATHLALARLLLLGAVLPVAGMAAGPASAQRIGPALDASHAPPAPPHEHGAAGGPGRTSARAGAGAYIVWPRDGAVLRSTRVKVRFGAYDIGVAPAGVEVVNTGHHHLLMDTPLPEDMSAPIPSDRNHVHFGAGQTETFLDLQPGTHTLQLLMGDAGHLPHDPPVLSPRITIRVRPGMAAQRVAAR